MIEPNVLEMEQHSNDDLKCIECQTAIRYCHGDTDLCSACRKGNWTDSEQEY